MVVPGTFPECLMTSTSPFVAVGDLPFNSTITMTQEFLPVTISFVAQKNCVSLTLYSYSRTYLIMARRISCCSTFLLSCRMPGSSSR